MAVFLVVACISLVLARDVIWRHRAKVVVKLEFVRADGVLGMRPYATNDFGRGVIYSEARLMCSEAIWRKARLRLEARASAGATNSALAVSGAEQTEPDLPGWEIEPLGVRLVATGADAKQTAALLNHIAEVYREGRNELYPAPPGCEAIHISIAEPALPNGRSMEYAPFVRIILGAGLIGLAAALLARRPRAAAAFSFRRSLLFWSCVSCGAAMLILPMHYAVGIAGALLLSFLMAAGNQCIALASSRGSPVPALLLKFTFMSVFLGYIGWGVATQLLEAKFALNRTRIRVDVLESPARRALPLSYDPAFIVTECQIIESGLILSPLVRRLNLHRTLNHRYDSRLSEREGEVILGARVLAKARQPGNVIDIYHWDDYDGNRPGQSREIAEEYQGFCRRRSLPNHDLKVEVALLGSEPSSERDTRVDVANVGRLVTEGMICGLFALAGGLSIAWQVKKRISLKVVPVVIVLYLAALGVALLPPVFVPVTYSASSLVRTWPPLDPSPETADSPLDEDELVRARQRRASQAANSDALFERMVNSLKLHADFAKQDHRWEQGADAEKRGWLRSHLKAVPVGDAYLLKFSATAEKAGDATLIATLAADHFRELIQLSAPAPESEALAVEILEKGRAWPWPEQHSNPIAEGLLNVLGYMSLIAAGAGIGWIGFVIRRARQTQAVA